MLLLITLVILAFAVAVASYGTMWITGKALDLGFLGALIGAAGTIFAATIAYVAVQEQIDLARRQANEASAAQKQFQRQNEINSLLGLQSLRKELQNVIDLFPKEASPGVNRDRFIELQSAAKLPLNLPSVFVPGDYFMRSQSFLQRLQMLAGQIANLRSRMTSGGMSDQHPDWNAADANVADAVNQGRLILPDIEVEIKRRERVLADE